MRTATPNRQFPHLWPPTGAMAGLTLAYQIRRHDAPRRPTTAATSLIRLRNMRFERSLSLDECRGIASRGHRGADAVKDAATGDLTG